MKKGLLSAILSVLVIVVLTCFSSCKDEYSSDEPLPTEYTASIFTGSNNKIVYSVDAKSGKVKWKTPVDGEIHATPVLFNDALWVGTNSGTLYQMDYKTGKILQTKTYSGAAIEGTPLPYNGYLLVAAGKTLHCVDVNTLTDIWSYSAAGDIMSSPTSHAIPVQADSAIFISSMANEVIALRIDGTMIWTFSPTGGQGFYSSPCVVNDSFLYIGNDNGNVYAVNIQDGTKKWEFATQGMVRSSPIQRGGNVLVGSNDRYFYSVDSATGLLRWKIQTDDQIASSPVVDNQFVYFGSYDGNLYCVDIINGRINWKRQSFGLIKASPLVHNGAVYVGSFDKILYKLDTADGGEIWTRDLYGQMEASAILDTIGGAAVPSISGAYKY